MLQSEEVKAHLKKVPFTEPPPKPPKERPIRDSVRSKLRKDKRINDSELEYMKEHPEDMEWLERKVKPRFWSNFLAQIKSRPREKEEEERRKAEYAKFNHSKEAQR